MNNFTDGNMKKSGDYEIPEYVEKSFDAGEIVLQEGVKDNFAYKILEGTVGVFKSSDNGEIKLAELNINV